MSLDPKNPAPLMERARRYLPAAVFAAFSGSFLLRIVAIVLGFVSVTIIARWLEPAGFGRYSYALAWANLLFVPAMLGVDKLFVREVAICDDRRDWGALRTLLRWGRTRSLLFALVVVAVFSAVVWYALRDSEPERLWTTLLAAPLILILAAARLNQSTLQGLKRIVAAQIPDSVIRPLALIVVVAVLASMQQVGASSENAMRANLVAAGIALLAGMAILRRVSPLASQRPGLQPVDPKWAASAFPLMIVGVMQTANAQAALLILGTFGTAEELGLFSAASRLAGLLGFFLIAFNSALAPHFAALFAARKKHELQQLVTRSARVISLLTVPAAIGMILLAPFILSLFGPKYVAATNLFVILVIATSISNVMGAVGLLLTMTGHERDAVAGLVVALIFNVVLLSILVPKFGPLGAALSTLIYMITWNTAFAIFVYRRTGIVPSVIGSFARKYADGNDS